MIKQAPLTFLFIFALAFGIAFLIVRHLYREVLENKNSLIASLRENASSTAAMSIIASEDRKAIDRVVRVVDYTVGNSGIFVLNAPHLNFKFTVFNGSVYEVSLDHRIEGRINYSGRALAGRLEIIPEDQRVKNLKHGHEETFGIRLWLDSQFDVDIIKQDGRLRDFDFKYLVIMINGEGFMSKPLSFASVSY